MATKNADQVASASLKVRSRHVGSIRFDSPDKAADPIMSSVYLDKTALSMNFAAPKPGMIPGSVEVTVKVTSWVKADEVPTGEEIKAERQARKAARMG